MTRDEFHRTRVDTLALTQDQLATVLGVSRTYVSALEQGHRVISYQIAMLMLAFRGGWRTPNWPRR